MSGSLSVRERFAKFINEMRLPFVVVHTDLPPGKRDVETTSWQTLSTDEAVDQLVRMLGPGERVNTLEGESFRAWRVPPSRQDKPVPSPFERWHVKETSSPVEELS